MTATGKEIEQVLDAHAALRESEERYRAVVQQVAEAIFLLDVETMHLLEANSAFLRLLSYSHEEVPQLTIYDLLPYERSLVDSAARKAVDKGEHHLGDQQYRRKDGSLVDVQVSITSIFYGGKRVLCEVLRDITEQKRIGNLLAERVRQQAAVAELGQRALAGVDLETLMSETATLVMVTLEVEFCKILELLPDLTGLLLLAGAGWRDGLVGTEVLGTGLDSQSGYTLVSDEPVIVEDLRTETRFNGPPLLSSHGVVSGMSVIIRGRGRPFGVIGAHTTRRRQFTQDDINFLQSVANVLASAVERNKVEEELHASRHQLEVILQGVADGITVQDTSGRLIYANNAAVNVIGYSSQEEFLATPQAEVLSKFDMVDADEEPLSPTSLPGRYALQGQETAEMLVGWRVRDTGETHWSVVKAAPVRNDLGQVQLAVSIFRDVTAQVETERRKDDFIALASHELKTPITSMKMFTQLLIRRLRRMVDAAATGEVTAPARSDDTVADTLKQLVRMDEQVDRLTQLVRDLLDASRISAGKLMYTTEETDIAELVQDTVLDLQRIAPRHTIVLEEQSSRQITIDRERIRQVLTNLITNAIKYSPNADRIIARVRSERDQNRVVVSVQDFGIGIPRSEQANIFNRFFQVSSPKADSHARDTFPGLGLGLYISSEIITRHGGQIWVESDVGKGSTFYFALPTTDDKHEEDDRRRRKGKT